MAQVPKVRAGVVLDLGLQADPSLAPTLALTSCPFAQSETADSYCQGSGSSNTSGQLSQPLQQQNESFSCGASSTRLALWEISGSDPGEGGYTQNGYDKYGQPYYYGSSGLASELHTDSTWGTFTQNIPKVLNNHQSRNPYQFSVPGSPDDLMTYITIDVHDSYQSLSD